MAEIIIERYSGGFCVRFGGSKPANGTYKFNYPSFLSSDVVRNREYNYTTAGITKWFDIAENTSDSRRSGQISFTATTAENASYDGTATVTCAWTLTQKCTADDPETLEVAISPNTERPATACTSILSITSNTDWEITIPQAYNWLHVSQSQSMTGTGNSTRTISIDPNYTRNGRHGFIIIETLGGIQRTVDIDQSGASNIRDIVEIGSTSISVAVGATYYLVAQHVTYVDNVRYGREDVTVDALWYSDDTTVASVVDGIVTGVDVGNTQVFAHWDGLVSDGTYVNVY